MPVQIPTNDIAKLHEQIANQLKDQTDDLYRMKAVRHKAKSVRAGQASRTEIAAKKECVHINQARQGCAKNGVYETDNLARTPENALIEDDLVDGWWACPSCGHHSYAVRNSYESDYNHEDLGIITVLVCTRCGYMA